MINIIIKQALINLADLEEGLEDADLITPKIQETILILTDLIRDGK